MPSLHPSAPYIYEYLYVLIINLQSQCLRRPGYLLGHACTYYCVGACLPTIGTGQGRAGQPELGPTSAELEYVTLQALRKDSRTPGPMTAAGDVSDPK